MYDELIKNLRYLAKVYSICGNESMQEYKLAVEAADAIETLYAAYTESFSIIAKAFRNNPKDLVLREYMMKNACCCEVKEGE